MFPYFFLSFFINLTFTNQNSDQNCNEVFSSIGKKWMSHPCQPTMSDYCPLMLNLPNYLNWTSLMDVPYIVV